MNWKEEFFVKLNALASLCRYVIPDALLAMYDRAAQNIGYEKAVRALNREIVTHSSRDPFPSIADLLAEVSTDCIDPEEVAAKLTGAVSKFGPYLGADARIYLGEIAWKIVQIEGGWESVCQMLSYENMAVMKAQWRKLADVLIQREKRAQPTFLDRLQPISQALPKTVVPEIEGTI